jgi:hypothetical protein
VPAYATGELMAVAPIDCSRLVFAGMMGFLLFAELPDRNTLVGAAIIVGSTLYIAYRETCLSRTHRAVLAVRPIAAHPEDGDAPQPRSDASASNGVGTVVAATIVPLSGTRYSGACYPRRRSALRCALFSRHHCVS